MQFDKPTGLYLNNPEHREYLRVYKVSPILIDTSSQKHKEPEPMIGQTGERGMRTSLSLICQGVNSSLIRGQVYEDKDPLTSLLFDTVDSAYLAQNNISLRHRFETNPADAKEIRQQDWNEKTSLRNANLIGGLPNRLEKEYAQHRGDTMEQGFNRFIEYMQNEGNPAFSGILSYNTLRGIGGYVCSRSEYGFMVKHPSYPLLGTFALCNDRWRTFDACTNPMGGTRYVTEFENRQIFGELPGFARNPDGLEHLICSWMTGIRDDLAAKTKGAKVSLLSKADITVDAYSEMIGNHSKDDLISLSRVFGKGVSDDPAVNGVMYALMADTTPEEFMSPTSLARINQMGAKLHHQRGRNPSDLPQQHISRINTGSFFLARDFDFSPPAPVAYN